MLLSGSFARVLPQCTNYRKLSGTISGSLRTAAIAGADVPVLFNTGLSTIQFQSLSVAADDARHTGQGGNQDNGTFEHVDSSNFAWSQDHGTAMAGSQAFSSATAPSGLTRFSGSFTMPTSIMATRQSG